MKRRLAVGALLGVVVMTAALVLTSGSGGYTVRAVFADAAGLRSGFLVRTGGVPVGTVARVDLGKADRAVAVLHLDKSSAPIGQGAHAEIRPSNLMGEKFVDLDPGDVQQPQPSGTTIPMARTGTPPELDDLLDVFDHDTRVALAAFLAEQGTAVAGRGGDIATTLMRMPPALDQAQQLMAGLGRDNQAMARMVVASDRVLASVAAQRPSLGKLVDTAGGALQSLASRRSQLGDTVRKAPATLAQVRQSLVTLEQAAAPLIPAARGLRATAAPLTSTLRQIPSFVASADPTLRIAQNVSPSLDRLGRGATPFVRRLGPATAKLNEFATALDPVSNVIDTGDGDLMGIIEGWARAIQNRDAAGHVYRINSQIGDNTLEKLQQQFISPQATNKERHGHQLLPGLEQPSLPQLPVPQLPQPRLPNVPTPPVPHVQVPASPSLPDIPTLPRPQLDGRDSALLDYLMGR
jgi:virulence factor Mce-like protein